MMDESSRCSLYSTELAEAARKKNYEGEWALVAVAAAAFEIAAALRELNDFLAWQHDQNAKMGRLPS